MPNKISTIFIGTPAFAVPSLEALLDDDFFQVVGVVTQPDKKVGRKQILTPPPVKITAEKNNIPVYQPEKIRDWKFEANAIDLIVVVAYAQIIPELLLNFPKYGCINVHGSLLPKYRGASCVQAVIADGEAETGITIMKMDKGLDTGPIISQSKINIEDNDTGGSMFSKLSELGAKILTPALKKYIKGEIIPTEQDPVKSTYVGMLKKDDGRISWGDDAIMIERFIRSRLPWPCAWAKIKSEGQKIIKITAVEHDILQINRFKLGEIFLHDHKLSIQCGKNALIIKKIQLEGKKEIGAEEFLRGYPKFVGITLN